MKKHLFLFTAFLICASIVFDVSAERNITTVLYAGGGPGQVVSPSTMANSNLTRFGFSGGIGFSFNSKIEIVGRVSYTKFPIEYGAGFSVYSYPPPVERGDWDLVTFGLDFKYLFNLDRSSSVDFYLLNGVGVGVSRADGIVPFLISPDLQDEEIPSYLTRNLVQNETRVYLNTGAGFDFRLSSATWLWFEGRVVYLFNEGERLVSLPINAGLKFAFGSR